jgi:hypothetical protein
MMIRSAAALDRAQWICTSDHLHGTRNRAEGWITNIPMDIKTVIDEVEKWQKRWKDMLSTRK